MKFMDHKWQHSHIINQDRQPSKETAVFKQNSQLGLNAHMHKRYKYTVKWLVQSTPYKNELISYAATPCRGDYQSLSCCNALLT
jgi:hypothetical protein